MFLHFVMFKDEHVRKKSFSYSGPLHIYIFFFFCDFVCSMGIGF